MPRITGGGFCLRYFNLIVGAIYFVCSLLGFLLMKCIEMFAFIPLWVVIVGYLVVGIVALAAAHKYRGNCYVQLAAYAAIAIPFGLVVEFFVMTKITAWAKGGDAVYRAGLICSLAIGLITVMAALMPGWLLKIKRAGIFAAISYIIALFAAVGLVNEGVLKDAGAIVFSIIAFAIVVYCWHLGVSDAAKGIITVQDAVSMPASSFLSIVDKAQAVDDG